MLDDQTRRLLTDIRDLHREHLEEYRRFIAEVREEQQKEEHRRDEMFQNAKAHMAFLRRSCSSVHS